MTIVHTRRQFLASVSMAGAAGLLGVPAEAGEERLETTSVRFMRTPSICHAPEFVIEDLLRAEGFTDIRYIEGASSAEINEAVASGKVDFDTHYAPQWTIVIDGGGPVTVLGGVHVGCFELFGNASIRSIADLKGKTVGVAALGSSDHLFVSVMAAHIGLDPANDIRWVTQPITHTRGAVCGRQDRRLPRPASRPSGAARAQYRPRRRQQRRGPAVVGIFLLHAGGPPRLCSEKSGRHQARAARRPERGGPLCRRA
jgi:ABC-type nitrate/sulfonate/bicarbonate transport system substrate-binding protein